MSYKLTKEESILEIPSCAIHRQGKTDGALPQKMPQGSLSTPALLKLDLCISKRLAILSH